MRLSAVLASLERLVRLFEAKGVDYMLIGGYALPFYGRIRATLDVDLAVAVKGEKELKQLRGWLESAGFEVTLYSPSNPVQVVVDRKEKVEFELWLKPDGVVFDGETLRRRKRVKLSEGFEVWIISAEDFIVNKLARPDRGAVDEQDVKSVLVRQEGKLDTKYLQKRAKQTQVQPLLEAIQKL
jgi:predicted nucleotidyltransferase